MLKDYEQKDYIEALLCLQRLPSKADPAVIPGARTRWDDFNSVHLIKTRGFIEKNGGIHRVVSPCLFLRRICQCLNTCSYRATFFHGTGIS